MKDFVKLVAMLILFVSITNCHPDPCEVDHTIIDGECIPNYIYPNPNLKSGERFYHRIYGIVTFKEGSWYNEGNLLISELGNKNN